MRASTLGGGGGRQGRCAHGMSNRGPFDVPDLVELCGGRSNNASRNDYGYSAAVNPTGPARSSARGGANVRNCTPALGGTLPTYAMREQQIHQQQQQQQQMVHDNHLYQQHLHQHHNHNAAQSLQNNDRRFNPVSGGSPMNNDFVGASQDHAGRNFRGGPPNNPVGQAQPQVLAAGNPRHQENHYCAMPQMNNGRPGCCCPPPGGSNEGGVGPLPDILNSHRVDVPPPYEPVAAPSRLHAVQFNAAAPGNPGAHNHGWANNASPQLVSTSTLSRVQVPLVARLSGGVNYKHCFNQQCCLRCVVAMTTFRWMLAAFALLGIGCIVSGLVLGALQMASGSGYLLHSLLFMGLGVLLVVVIGIGWRCTPEGQEPCHLFLNLTDGSMYSAAGGGTDGRLIYRRWGRGQSTYSQWHGGVCYPEFLNRCPPPSYSAAVQDSQRQQMMARLHLVPADGGEHNGERQGEYSPASPPPTYRSQSSISRPLAPAVAASSARDLPLNVPGPDVQSAPAALQPPPRYPSSSFNGQSPPLSQLQPSLSAGCSSPLVVQRCNYQTLPLARSHQGHGAQGQAWLVEPLQQSDNTSASSSGGAQNLYESRRLCGCRPPVAQQLEVSETNFVTASNACGNVVTSSNESSGETRITYASASAQYPRSAHDKAEHLVDQVGKSTSVGTEQVYNECQYDRRESAPVCNVGKSAVVQKLPIPVSKPVRSESTKLSQRPIQYNAGTVAPALSGCGLLNAQKASSDKAKKDDKVSENSNLGISDYYTVSGERGCATVDEGFYNSSQIKCTRRSDDLWLSDFPTEPRVRKATPNGASSSHHVPASCLNVILPALGADRAQQRSGNDCNARDHDQRKDALPFSENVE